MGLAMMEGGIAAPSRSGAALCILISPVKKAQRKKKDSQRERREVQKSLHNFQVSVVMLPRAALFCAERIGMGIFSLFPAFLLALALRIAFIRLGRDGQEVAKRFDPCFEPDFERHVKPPFWNKPPDPVSRGGAEWFPEKR